MCVVGLVLITHTHTHTHTHKHTHKHTHTHTIVARRDVHMYSRKAMGSAIANAGFEIDCMLCVLCVLCVCV